MTDNRHWDGIYEQKEDQLLSWHQGRPERSLALVGSLAAGTQIALIDVGAGTSPLIGILLERLTEQGVNQVVLQDGAVAGFGAGGYASSTVFAFDNPKGRRLT